MGAMTTAHWTKKSFADFVYRISFDFVAQLRTRLEDRGITRADFAKRAKIDKARVSQVFNNPGNLGLESMTRYAHALGMKVAIVAYDDGDSGNLKGPINSAVFTTCWKRAGAPTDFFELSSTCVHQLVQQPDTSDTGVFTSRSTLGYTYPTQSVVNSYTLSI
jgi:transcriptional regulator with XRE-family HTH domain